MGAPSCRIFPYKPSSSWVTPICENVRMELGLVSRHFPEMTARYKPSLWLGWAAFIGIYNSHRIRMYAMYGNIYHQYIPVLLASIYHTWILWDLSWFAYGKDIPKYLICRFWRNQTNWNGPRFGKMRWWTKLWSKVCQNQKTSRTQTYYSCMSVCVIFFSHGGFLSHRGTPSHHPFRTMGF